MAATSSSVVKDGTHDIEEFHAELETNYSS